jgi:uncharacterized protein YfiM (DUF2279 family)
MIDLQAVRDRVYGLGFAFTGNAVDATDAIQNMSAPNPSAYVSTARERAARNKNATGRHTQIVEQTVSILFAVGAERADGRQSDDVEDKKNAIIESLMGWTAPGSETPFSYDSFAIRFMDQGVVWGELLFAAKYLRTKAQA